MTPAEILALLDRNLPAGITAAADLRLQRTQDASQGGWRTGRKVRRNLYRGYGPDDDIGRLDRAQDAEHIAASANPAANYAAVRRWQATVERHTPVAVPTRHNQENVTCLIDYAPYPCPDLTDTADEVRAYLESNTP